MKAYQQHMDGSLIFQTAEDRARENAIAELLAQEWGLQIRHFAPLSPIDWYAVRDDRVVGVLELKGRTVGASHSTDVLISVRKWLALVLGSLALGVPGRFVLAFTDELRYIDLKRIDPRRHRIAGNPQIATEAAFEPMIIVPVEATRFVCKAPEPPAREPQTEAPEPTRPWQNGLDGEEIPF